VARATIKDIALLAKVSPMTVSNVINGRSAKASTETIERINAAIAELGYTPNLSARALVSNASRMVGVLIPFTENQNALLLDNPFYAEIVSGIETALRAEGFYMMLSGVGEKGAKLDALSSWNMDALIVLGVYREALYEQLKSRNLPTLLIDSYIDDDHFYHLSIDDEQAAFDATSHLVAQGHRDVAVVTGVIRADGVVERRVAGYRRALAAARIDFDPTLVFAGSVTFDWGSEAAAGIAANPRITAAFCTADLIAAGLLAGLHKLGKRIPDDVSVMGFDNLSISTMVYPALTTVDQSIAEKGRLAGNLIASILNKRATERNTIVPTTVVERDSVKRRG
jgi:LacI family transcriptional regulator